MSKEVMLVSQRPKLLEKDKKIRVAAYARVSTDSEDQQSSLASQKTYFEKFINDNPKWEFKGLYADEGISGLSAKNRESFNKMIADALNGEIDRIITKSISRFARNTLDTIRIIRKLKEKGISVYFQKEKIHTLESDSEFILTLMSSFAQEESRSISENVVWGHRRRFAQGKVSVPYSTFLGYDKGEDGNLIINRKQARIIEFIYSLYILGINPYSIVRYLEKYNIPTPRGKNKWNSTVVRSMLSNEKYKGDALLQKCFTINYITKKKKKNEGELPQYYVEDNHEAIIPRKIHDFVQKKIEEDKKFHDNGIWRGKIYCAKCGGLCGRLSLHPERGSKKAWVCKNKYSKIQKCPAPYLYEIEICKIITTALIERAVDKKMIAKIMKLVTASKKRMKSAKEEVEAFIYDDYVADKDLLELLLKKLVFHYDGTVDMELIDGTTIIMKMEVNGKSGGGRGIWNGNICE